MYNIYNQPMRDSAEDFRTGWINHGMIYNTYSNPAENEYGISGLGALGEAVNALPPIGQKHVAQALADPDTRPVVEELLRSPNPSEALAAQFDRDVMEAYRPTGKPIVFKELAAHFGPKLQAAEDAIVDALPTKDTPEGRDAFDIVQIADDKIPALTHYYTQIGLEALSPEWFATEVEGVSGYDDEDDVAEEAAEFGLGITKKAKKIMKNVAIGAAIAAGAVLTAGVIIPAISAALPTIIGAVTTMGKSVFGAVKGFMAPGAPGKEPEVEIPTVTQAQFDSATKKIYDTAKTNPAAAKQLKMDLVMQIAASKEYTFAAAVNLVDKKLAAYKAADAEKPPEKGEIDWVALANAALESWSTRDTDPGASAEMQRRMIEYFMNNGYSQGEANAAVMAALAKVQAAKGEPPAAGPSVVVTTTTTPGFEPDDEEPTIIRAGVGMPGWVIPAAIGVFLLMSRGGGGGARRRTRRNPRRRSHRRRRAS